MKGHQPISDNNGTPPHTGSSAQRGFLDKHFNIPEDNHYEFLSGSMVIPPLEFTRVEKIRQMIRQCMSMDIEIPIEWVEEYNSSVKE